MSCREVENITTENNFDVKTEITNTLILNADSISTTQNNTTNSTNTEVTPKDPPSKDKEDW